MIPPRCKSENRLSIQRPVPIDAVEKEKEREGNWHVIPLTPQTARDDYCYWSFSSVDKKSTAV